MASPESLCRKRRHTEQLTDSAGLSTEEVELYMAYLGLLLRLLSVIPC